MKNLNTNYVYEYQYNTFINEGKLGEAIKNFWNWLIGNKADSKYMPNSKEFDENGRNKLYSASDGKYGWGPADLKEIKDLVAKHTIESNSYSYFDKTSKYLNDSGEAAKNKRWVVGAFKSESDDSSLITVICCYDMRDDKIQNAAKINFIDIYKTSAAEHSFTVKNLRDMIYFIMKLVYKDGAGYVCNHVCMYEKNDKKFIKMLKEYPDKFTLDEIENDKKKGIKITKE